MTVSGAVNTPSANFTRPGNTDAYASGDLVANNTTAGSVAPMSWIVGRGSASSAFGGMIRRARVKKSGTGVTNASFRLHLYTSSPTVTNGDNGAWASIIAGYIGAIDVTVDKAFSDGAAGMGAPTVGSEINFKASDTLYGLLEARGAYTPGNAEVFTVELEALIY